MAAIPRKYFWTRDQVLLNVMAWFLRHGTWPKELDYKHGRHLVPRLPSPTCWRGKWWSSSASLHAEARQRCRAFLPSP